MSINYDFVVLISANAEWREIKKIYPEDEIRTSPYGEWLEHTYPGLQASQKPVAFMHGGWGKVAAAGSTQYAIDQWHPKLIVNLGTCGGFDGEVQRGDIVLVDTTVIYDIFEQMGDPQEHIQHYMSQIDNSWLSDLFPQEVIRTTLVSGDRDLFPEDLLELKLKYGAIAGDWESGAIAWIAAKNHTQCLILRGVTDLVGAMGGEAYEGKVNFYYENTALVMKKLAEALPQWLLNFKP